MTTTQAGIDRPQVQPGQLFIDGGWREGAGGGRMDVIDPSTGDTVTTVAAADGDDVDAAVAAARLAFDQGPWPRTPPRERARVLLRVAGLVRERADELTAVESLDVGKPVTLCRAVDVETIAQEYEYCAALAQTLDGATRQIPLPAHAYTRREPVGVVAAITPCNFPLILSSSKLAPALAAGDAVVHKPADETPLSALLMADILGAAGVPPGVVNVVTGTGAEAGDALLRHDDTDLIAFTGSTRVGRMAAAAGGERLTPVTMELGGNAAHIVFDDADVERAVGTAIEAAVFNTGQFCMSGPRLLVAEALYEPVLDALGAAVGHVLVGDPFDPATVVGPMVAQRHLDQVARYVADARAAGATVVAGGGRPDLSAGGTDLGGGFFHEPTVLAGLPNDAAVVQEEVFGPVLTVQPFADEDEAIALANSTPYGLAAGLHTVDVTRAHRVAERLRAGIVWVNSWALLDPAVPFGGVGQSGYGREYGPEGLDAYTRVKSVVVSLG